MTVFIFLIGVVFGLVFGAFLDANDILYCCPRCKLQGEADTWKKLSALGKRLEEERERIRKEIEKECEI